MCELEMLINQRENEGICNPAYALMRNNADQSRRLFLQGQFRYLEDWYVIISITCLRLLCLYNIFLLV